jgi:hypothetical protein
MADGLNKNLNNANKSAKDLKGNMDGASDSAKSAADNMGRFTDSVNDSAESFNDYRDTLRSISAELGNQINNVKDVKKEYNKLDSIARKLSDQEVGINRLKDSQLDKLKQNAASSVEELKNRTNALQVEKLTASTGKELMSLSGAAFETTLKSIAAKKKLSKEEVTLIRASKQNFQIEQELLDKIEKEVDIRKESNRLMGIGGGLMKGLNQLGGKFAQSLGLEKVTSDMQKMADEIARGTKSSGALGGKMKVLGVGIKSAFTNIGGSLMDPTVIFGALIKGFNDVDKAATDFARQTGQDLNGVEASLATANMGYVNMADYIKAATALTSELKMSATDIFSPEDILEVAQMTDEMGMAGKAAANLAKLSKLNGTSVRENNESIIQGVNSFNKQNGAAINSRKVLDDIANTSQGVLTKFAGMPGKLTEAASAAAGIGMSLEQVDKIAGSLLQFEQSISAEMEAELLTGKSLNLEKAREAALTNDLATVAKEMSKQIGTSADFAKMNRIQQEATAKAMGMTSDELAGMLLQEDLKAGLNEDSLNAAQKQTLESQKNRTAQEQIAQALGKIGQAFAPIIGFIAKIVSNSKVIYALMGVALLTKLGGITSAFGKMGKAFGGIKDAGKSMMGFFNKSEGGFKGLISSAKKYGNSLIGAFKGTDGVAGKFYKGGQFMPGGERAPKGGAISKVASGAKDKVSGLKDKITDKIKDKVDDISDSADKSKGIDEDAGKGVKEFLKGLSEGLKSMASMEVVGGALALIPAAIGLTAMIPGSVGAYLMSKIDGKKLEESLKGLSEGLKAIDPMAMFGALALIPAAVGLTAMIPGAVGAYLISKVDGEGFKEGLVGIADGLKEIDGQAMLGGLALIPIALGLAAMLPGVVAILAISAVGPLAEAGFKGLGKGLMFFGDNFGKIIQGSLALGIAGLAVAGSFALALMMIKDVDPTQMIAFAGSLAIFGTTAALLGSFSSLVIQGALALGILGLALIPAAFAFNLISGVDVNSMIAFSIALPLLALAAAGLGLIAPFILAGSLAIAALGLAIIPAAMAFGMLAGSGFTDQIDSLSQLAVLGSGLFGVGAGLISIAAGLGAMSLAGLLAMPTLLALTALGAVSGGLGSIFGGAEETDNGNQDSALSEKLDQVNNNILKLISVVEAGGDVIMDGAVVGKTVSMASSRIG